MRRWFSSRGNLRAALAGRATLIAFVLFVLLAGSNAVAIRLSNHGLPPFWGAAVRFGLAAGIFWVIVLVRRIALPRGRALLGAVLYGVVAIGASFALLYWILVRVQAGKASVFFAFIPLTTLFLAAAHGLEALSWRRVIGGLIAVAGMLVVVRGGLGTALTLPLVLALIGFVVCMAEGAVIFKLLPPGNPVVASAIGLTIGAIMLAATSLLVGEKWSLPATPDTWEALAYLVVFGSVLVFYLNLFMLGRWPASRVAFGFVLLPVVSVTVSALLTGEAVTSSLAVGALVVLLGVTLGAINRSRRPAAAEPALVTECATC